MFLWKLPKQNGKVDLNWTLMHLSDIKWSENTLKLRKGYQRNDKWRNKQKQTNRWAPLPFIDYEPEGHHNVISVMEYSGQPILLQSGSNTITLAVSHLHSSTKLQVMFVSIYNTCKCWSLFQNLVSFLQRQYFIGTFPMWRLVLASF